MPLPAALAARLAKRGLVKTSNKEEKDKNEEVFAESYDDPEESDSSVIKLLFFIFLNSQGSFISKPLGP